MVVRKVAWVLVTGCLALGCGESGSSAPSAVGGAAGTLAGGSAGTGATSSGAAGAGSGPGGGQSGGSAGTDGGVLDATCRERTTSHIAGSRIGLRTISTSEGDVVYRGFYDLELGHTCAFIPDVAGVLRCVPSGIDSVRPFYLDAACTDEVIYKGLCGDTYFAIPVTDDGCDTGQRAFEYGEELVGVAEVYERNATGACVAYGSVNRLYRRGPELALDAMPVVTATEWAGSGRIASRGFTGEGGLVAVRTYYDSGLDSACDFRQLSDGQEHCAPSGLARREYGDAACTTLPLMNDATSCGQPSFLYANQPSQDVCAPGTVFYEAGAEHTGPRFNNAFGTCAATPDADAAASKVFNLSEAPPSEFVAVEATVNEEDPGRLKPAYRTSSDGGCWFLSWWDSELQTRCRFETGTDDQLRCFPEIRILSDLSATTLLAFSDAGCTTEVQYLRMPACNAERVPKFLVDTVLPACTVSRVAARAVAATATAGADLADLWVQSGVTCTPFVKDELVYFELGPELDPAMFMAAQPDN